MKFNPLLLLRYFTLVAFLFLSHTSFAQNEINAVKPYEILSTDKKGNPTFIDFVHTKTGADNQSVYDFLKTIHSFEEHTTFETYLEKPFMKNGSFIRKQHQYYKGYKVEFGGNSDDL